jgi:type I restriction enzyme S subunit
MRWKRYPAYKKSGVEWLEAIPVDWEVKPLKRVSSINDDTLPEDTDDQFRMLYVDISSVDEAQGILRKQELTFEEAPSRARRLVKHGDVIVSTVRTYLRAIAPIVNPENNLVVSTGFAVVRPVDDKFKSTFAAYALRSQPFIESIMRFSVGVSYPAINSSTLGDLPLVLPPRGKQHRIAEFLDCKTSYIDTLIDKKRRQMELLDEKRIALITQAVTNGLDPNVKMKDSGVEWLGEVPEHWDLGRLKQTVNGIMNGIWGDEPEGSSDYWCVRVADFDRIGLSVSPEQQTKRSAPQHQLSSRLLRPYDLLIEKSGGGELQPVGAVVWFPFSARAACSNFIARIIPKNTFDSRFLVYVHYHLYQAKVNTRSIKQTTGIQNLDAELYLDELIAYPTRDEQRSIAFFLDRETARIDTLKDKIQHSIELLQEYRSALISAAVTGQIDVREEVM